MLKYGPYPYDLKRRVLSEIGHLSNEDCGSAILDILKQNSKCRKIVLGHLSNTNNIPELAYKAVKNILDEKSLIHERNLDIKLADRNKPSSYINF
jgi:phosphoribosyl 1,2-cyclic phosphodiesterase